MYRPLRVAKKLELVQAIQSCKTRGYSWGSSQFFAKNLKDEEEFECYFFDADGATLLTGAGEHGRGEAVRPG